MQRWIVPWIVSAALVALPGLASPPEWAFHREHELTVRDRNASAKPELAHELNWLARHQDEDGHWDAAGFMKHDPADDRCTGAGLATHDVGIMALALLAFLGDGSTTRSGPRKSVVKKACGWLVAQQDARGRFGNGATADHIFDHAIATWALCEAGGLSESKALLAVAQKGIDHLERHRDPRGVWRYMPAGAEGDTAITGWCLLAYHSAREFKLEVNADAFPKVAAWLDAVTAADGRTGYSKRGEIATPRRVVEAHRFPPEHNEAMTSVGLLCRHLLGQDPKTNPVVGQSADLIAKKPPRWDEAAGSIDLYAWFFATMALYHHGGQHWASWSKALTATVVARQRKDGAHAGSWDPDHDAWGALGGRVYSTALGILILETYYRYTRLVR